MTTPMPEPLHLAERLGSRYELNYTERNQAAAVLRNQHATIERMNAAAIDSNLILEQAQAANLEILAAMERITALEADRAMLRKVLLLVKRNVSFPEYMWHKVNDVLEKTND